MHRTSRRHILGALAGFAGSARLLPFLPAAVRAAEAPKRLLVIFQPMGYLEDSFWPTTSPGGGMTLGESLRPLDEWKQQLTFIDGLLMLGAQWYYQNDDNEHGTGMAMTFTGAKKATYATGQSIDQAIADHLYAQKQTAYRHLALGVQAPNPSGHSSCFFSKPGTPVNAQNNAQAAFDSLFAKFVPPTADPGALERSKRLRKSILDAVKADLNVVCKGAGADDKVKCDAHLEGLRMIERRLESQSGEGTTACTKPTFVSGTEVAAQIHTTMDIITSAFACDLVRVASLQLGHCDGFAEIEGLNQHDVTHKVGDTNGAPEWIARHKQIDRWYASRWAYLLKRLSSIPEGNGTMLDNTLILVGYDTTTVTKFAMGPHYHSRFPYLVAGGGNFAWKTGRHLMLRTGTSAVTSYGGNVNLDKGFPTNHRLFVSMARAFGMNIDKFGNMDPSSGPVAGL